MSASVGRVEVEALTSVNVTQKITFPPRVNDARLLLDAYLMNPYWNVLTLRQMRLGLFEVCMDFLFHCVSARFLWKTARVECKVQYFLTWSRAARLKKGITNGTAIGRVRLGRARRRRRRRIWTKRNEPWYSDKQSHTGCTRTNAPALAHPGGDSRWAADSDLLESRNSHFLPLPGEICSLIWI